MSYILLGADCFIQNTKFNVQKSTNVVWYFYQLILPEGVAPSFPSHHKCIRTTQGKVRLGKSDLG